MKTDKAIILKLWCARDSSWDLVQSTQACLPGDSDLNGRLRNSWIRGWLKTHSYSFIRYFKHSAPLEDTNHYEIWLQCQAASARQVERRHTSRKRCALKLCVPRQDKRPASNLSSCFPFELETREAPHSLQGNSCHSRSWIKSVLLVPSVPLCMNLRPRPRGNVSHRLPIRSQGECADPILSPRKSGLTMK